MSRLNAPLLFVAVLTLAAVLSGCGPIRSTTALINAQQAAIEAEVSKRIAERTGYNAPASKKSLAPTTQSTPVKRTGVTKLDPQPEVTDGMKGLAAWLEGRLVEREGPTN